MTLTNIDMRKILLCLVLAAFHFVANAQEDEKLPALNSIRTPNSPAFSILGVQPTSVERPNTPSDVSVALDNATEGFTKFPENYAIEFAPYWISKAPASLTWRNDIKRDVVTSITRTLSASLATTSKKINDKNLRGLSYGFRAMILSGEISKKSVEEIESLEGRMKNFSAAFSDAFAAQERAEIQSFWASLDPALPADEKQRLFSEFNSGLQKRRAQHLAEQQDKFEKIAGKLKDNYAPQREGLILEVAYASAYRNDTLVTDKLKKSGWAWWLTPSYVKDEYSVVGVYRQQKDSLGNKSSEYGMRFIYSKDRYALSLEYLKGEYKSEIALPDRERLSVLFEYLLSEKLWITLSFGEDNKNMQTESPGSLFSAIGVRYNLSKERFGFSPN
jgi:hypothetical protein